jgi:tripartite-type tricarboxylate transporter receptor subunit TctC
MPRTSSRLAALALALGTTLSLGASAQAWPNKPIRFIVPFAAGGVADVVTRAVTPRLSEALGQPIVVENRGGAGGTLGTSQGAKAPPDGYTFVVPAASHTTTPSLYTKLDFDPVKDFTAVTKIADVPYLLVVPASSPIKTFADFVRAGELLAGQIGAPLLHVPYKGSAPALIDLLGGQLAFMFDTINTSTQHIKAGKLRALGVGTVKRSTLLPEVAPIADSMPGFEAATWVGLLAPAGTPREIVLRMQQEIAKVLAAPDVQEKLAASGAEPVGNSPEQFGAYVAAEVQKWDRVVKQAKIPPVQ